MIGVSFSFCPIHAGHTTLDGLDDLYSAKVLRSTVSAANKKKKAASTMA